MPAFGLTSLLGVPSWQKNLVAQAASLGAVPSVTTPPSRRSTAASSTACHCAPWPEISASALRALSRHSRHLRRQLAHEQRHADQPYTSALLDKLDLLEVRLDRLFRQAADFHSLHIFLGCLQESMRILFLREKVRHSLEGQPY
ncbi:MAG: hypothetical protein WCD80_09025 [Desulfobaccales bacterium]